MQILHNKEIKNEKEYEKNYTFYDLFGSGRRIVLAIWICRAVIKSSVLHKD